MAVQSNKRDTMVIRVITAVDEGGAATLANRTINYLNPALTDQEVYLLGNDIAGLLANEQDSLQRKIQYDLSADPTP